MSFLSILVVLSSVFCSVCTVYVRWDGNSLFGSDLDAWALSKAFLNLMMLLLGVFWQFCSISMSFLSIQSCGFFQLLLVCCILCSCICAEMDSFDGVAVNIHHLHGERGCLLVLGGLL